MTKKKFFDKINFNKRWDENDWETFFQAQDSFRMVRQNEEINKKPLSRIKFNEQEYLVEYREYDAKDEVVHLRAFTTVIDDIKIVNINEIGGKVEYTYYKYRIESNKLIVAYASDEFIKTEFNSPQELSDFFNKNIRNNILFEPEITFNKSNSMSQQ